MLKAVLTEQASKNRRRIEQTAESLISRWQAYSRLSSVAPATVLGVLPMEDSYVVKEEAALHLAMVSYVNDTIDAMLQTREQGHLSSRVSKDAVHLVSPR